MLLLLWVFFSMSSLSLMYLRLAEMDEAVGDIPQEEEDEKAHNEEI